MGGVVQWREEGETSISTSTREKGEEAHAVQVYTPAREGEAAEGGGGGGAGGGSGGFRNAQHAHSCHGGRRCECGGCRRPRPDQLRVACGERVDVVDRNRARRAHVIDDGCARGQGMTRRVHWRACNAIHRLNRSPECVRVEIAPRNVEAMLGGQVVAGFDVRLVISQQLSAQFELLPVRWASRRMTNMVGTYCNH